jgi:hypothetical protein
MQALLTFHNHPHITHKAMDNTQRLCGSHPSLILGQPIQSRQHGLNITLPQQFFGELLYSTLSPRSCTKHMTVHLLNRPCLICFVVRASTKSSSTIILTIIFVIMGDGGIAV